MAKYGKCTLKVGSKNIELTFSLWALAQACEGMGIEIEEFLSLADEMGNSKGGLMKFVRFLGYAIAAAANENIPAGTLKYTAKDAVEMVEKAGVFSEEIKVVMKTMMESIAAIFPKKEDFEAAAPAAIQKKAHSRGKSSSLKV